MIKCGICGRPASVQVIHTINNIEVKTYLCDECAKLEEQSNEYVDMITPFFKGGARGSAPVCKCGMTLAQLVKKDKFGCADCYKTFAGVADGYVKDMKSGLHKGKCPNKEGRALKLEINALKSDLDKAIADKRFMDADALYNRLLQLERR